MRLCGRRPFLAVLIALVAALVLSAANATGARHTRATCTWGASSVRAQIVDGNIQATEPAISGCIPR
jgi:hypothetical protein